MNKFSLDFDKLAQTLNRKKTYKLSEVKDKIEKVAWDVVRFRDNDDTEMLWKIEDSPDGPIIVALYDEQNGKLKAESKPSDWEVMKEANKINVFYKQAHVAVLNKENLGIPEEELNVVCRWLPEKLASDEDYQAFVLSGLGENGISFIQSKYPELQKVASKAVSFISGKSVKRTDLSEIAEGIKNA